MPIDSFQLCFGFVILDSLVWGENCNICHLAYSAMAQLVLGRALKEQPGLLTQVILDEQGVSRHDGVIFFTWSFVNDWFLLEPHMSPSRGWGEPLLPLLHLPWRRRGGKQGTAMAGLWLSPPWASARSSSDTGTRDAFRLYIFCFCSASERKSCCDKAHCWEPSGPCPSCWGHEDLTLGSVGALPRQCVGVNQFDFP